MVRKINGGPAFFAAFIAFCSLLKGSAQEQLSFEVASIKQADTTAPGRVRGVTCRGVDGAVGHPLLTPNTGLGRCRMIGTNVKQLISSAYGVGLDEIAGGPSWVESLPYTIEAAAADPSARAVAPCRCPAEWR